MCNEAYDFFLIILVSDYVEVTKKSTVSDYWDIGIFSLDVRGKMSKEKKVQIQYKKKKKRKNT